MIRSGSLFGEKRTSANNPPNKLETRPDSAILRHPGLPPHPDHLCYSLQPAQELGLLGGNLFLGQDAFALQYGQPLDLCEDIHFLGQEEFTAKKSELLSRL